MLVATGFGRRTTILASLLAFAAGLVGWTFFEYGLHRWIMHSRNRRLWELLHQQHHQMREMVDPEHRLLHPFVTCCLFGGTALALSLASFSSAPITVAGFWLGYLLYEAIHWAHHNARALEFLADVPWFERRRDIHHDHHVRPRVNFGFTSSFWDHVFGTYLATDEVSSRAPHLANVRAAAPDFQE